ncbi:MAG: type II secretion system protein [Planctomycetota bacterium]|jgi:type II secretory pathway pseudopilin PulG
MTGEATKRRSGEATKGFTLVEMVIVIGVIILLAALTLSVSVAVVEGSEVRQTENTIRLLTAAIQEWEAQADRQARVSSTRSSSRP